MQEDNLANIAAAIEVVPVDITPTISTAPQYMGFIDPSISDDDKENDMAENLTTAHVAVQATTTSGSNPPPGGGGGGPGGLVMLQEAMEETTMANLWEENQRCLKETVPKPMSSCNTGTYTPR